MSNPLPENTTSLPQEIEGIFIGGGHNALVAASYLARAGVRTLVLESAPVVGGGLCTREATLPGFRHDLGAYFSRWTPSYRIWSELELGRHGLQAVVPEVQVALPLPEGGGLIVYQSVERTLDAIRRFSRRDADTYARVHPEFASLVRDIITPLRFAPPLPQEQRDSLLERTAQGRRYLALSRRDALSVVRELFEHEVVRAMVLFNVTTRGYLPVLDVAGTGASVAIGLVAAHGTAMHPGGSSEAARALVKGLLDHGGRVVTSARVVRIAVEGGRASAVELEDGRTVRATRFICSSLPPALTLGRLVEARHLDEGLRQALDSYRWQQDSLFGVHLALREPPRYRGVPEDAPLNRALNQCIGYQSSDDFERALSAIRERRIPETAMQAAAPSIFDPTRAPEGQATAFAWHFVPRDPLDGGPERWDGPAGPALAEAMLARWRELAPNLASAELARAICSPLDTERAIPSMVLGDRHHGSYHPDNVEANRPHPSLSSYRTPITHLYHCGSATHPGGTLSGQPGYNAATVVAQDLGYEAWWRPRTAQEAIAESG